VDDSTTRPRLQLALRAALKARDTVAISALRSALAAIDNAGAVPAGPPAGTAPIAQRAGAGELRHRQVLNRHGTSL